MGSELRRVPANWQHPKFENSQAHYPLFDGFEKRVKQWDEENEQWNNGFCLDRIGSELKYVPREECYAKGETGTFTDWDGERPEPEDYMLVGCPEALRTHFQWYENVTEGTPFSPIFQTEREANEWYEAQ